MRVLHVIPSIGPARGGPSMAVRLMARAARAAGAEVDIATTNDNDRELLSVPLGAPQLEEDGLRCHYFSRDARPYTTSRALAKWLRQQIGHYDVAHVHALFSFASTAAAHAARKRGVPYIIRPLGTLAPYGLQQHAVLKRVSWQLVEKRILRNAAVVHFTSEAERAEAERLGGGWSSVVLPLGIDISAFAPAIEPPVQSAFLFMSRIHPKKRLDLILHALARTPSAELDVAGGGEATYVSDLQRLATELGVAARVRWHGHVEGTRKAELLRKASVFVLPSFNENFGIAVVEALASGTPVIISRGVAIHEEVEAAGAGLVVGTDSADLAHAMQQMLEPARVHAAARAARALAEERFSMSAMTAGLMQLYEECARQA